MKEQISQDFTLDSNWEALETTPSNSLQYRWTKGSSTLNIKNGNYYTTLKIRIYNGTNLFKKRKLKILIDSISHREYIFTDHIQYLDIKLDIKNKLSVTFSTEDIFCPAKLDKMSTDNRLLGFKIYAFTIESENETSTLIPINELTIEREESFFVDLDLYKYNLSKISIKNELPVIHYTGQYGTSGYATAAKGYLYRYFLNNYNIKWNALKFDDSTLSKDCPYNIIVESLIDKNYSNYDMYIYHTTPDVWPYLNDEFRRESKNKMKIGYTVWETNRLPDKWITCINTEVDEVWCPSKYNKNVFEESGIKIPIKVAPHVFLKKPLFERGNIELYSLDGQIISYKEDIYTFYTIGEFNARKGIDELINVFCTTFTRKDKVRLLIKTHYKNYSATNKQSCIDKINDIIKQYENPPEIHCFLDNMSETELLALHSLGDCYISLTKSEGFGMTIFDAMNYGKQIIATGYSGHMDFLGEDHNGLVKFKLDYVKNMKQFSENYSEKTIWAYPDLEHAAELMKGMIK